MAITLNKAAIEHAKKLIKAGEVERMANFAGAKPTEDEVDKYINTHYIEEYGLWFLGTDTAKPKSKQGYIYPTGDLKMIFKSALEESKKKAAAAGHKEIEAAATELIRLIDTTKK